MRLCSAAMTRHAKSPSATAGIGCGEPGAAASPFAVRVGDQAQVVGEHDTSCVACRQVLSRSVRYRPGSLPEWRVMA
jgi:hypothetical protein